MNKKYYVKEVELVYAKNTVKLFLMNHLIPILEVILYYLDQIMKM